MAETTLERAERRFRQARAQLDAVRAREAKKERKLDTRRKVILGGALLDLAERDDVARAMLDRLVRNLSRDQDRAVFHDWEGPTRPSAARATGGSSAPVATPANAPAHATATGEASGPPVSSQSLASPHDPPPRPSDPYSGDR